MHMILIAVLTKDTTKQQQRKFWTWCMKDTLYANKTHVHCCSMLMWITQAINARGVADETAQLPPAMTPSRPFCKPSRACASMPPRYAYTARKTHVPQPYCIRFVCKTSRLLISCLKAHVFWTPEGADTWGPGRGRNQ